MMEHLQGEGVGDAKALVFQGRKHNHSGKGATDSSAWKACLKGRGQGCDPIFLPEGSHWHKVFQRFHQGGFDHWNDIVP
jgi:hypothetical protein